MSKRSSTLFIAVHCSATRPSMDIGVTEIRKWHVDGNGWSDVGYHLVIRRSGLIEAGRHMDDIAAHVAGFNSRALGICMVGGIRDDGEPQDNFTAGQFDALLVALRFCRLYAPTAKIQGHRDFPNVAKACPSFDVRAWLGQVAPELLT